MRRCATSNSLQKTTDDGRAIARPPSVNSWRSPSSCPTGSYPQISVVSALQLEYQPSGAKLARHGQCQSDCGHRHGHLGILDSNLGLGAASNFGDSVPWSNDSPLREVSSEYAVAVVVRTP